MKHSTLLFLPAFAWLAAAACCRKNLCLRDIVTNPDGANHCSALFLRTSTRQASTVTETVTINPTDHTTIVAEEVVTVTVTTTASTETVLHVVDQTVIDTVGHTVTQTTTQVETALQTITVTQQAAVAKRAPASSKTVPDYASACHDFAHYESACGCVATVSTVNIPAPPATTITVTATSALLSQIHLTAPTTTTTTLSLTATTTSTTTTTILATSTSTSTTTTIHAIPTTTTATATATATSTCRIGAALGAFRAPATQHGTTPLLIYANLLNGLTGGLTWTQPSSSLSAAVQNKYVWALDDAGRLNLAYNVPPYTYKYYAYMSTASPGSNWPQVGTAASVASMVNAGAAVAYVTGCVDSLTGELTLNAAGRKNMLWCGSQLWMSFGLGEDINRGECVQMFPAVLGS